MKYSILTLAAIMIIGLSSCEKMWDKKGKHCDCDKDKGAYKEYVYEPLVINSDCDCIVAGKVKYVGECGTVALLDYGNGTCDNTATKTICVDGKCDGAKVKTVEVTLDCRDNSGEYVYLD